MKVSIRRLAEGPIIRPHMDERMGDNINGPSLIKVPEWVEHSLGRYYLYFAHHDGLYMRMAFADELTGPWTTHVDGVMTLAASRFKGHIASPDVHVDNASRQFRMTFHGADFRSRVGGPAPQMSRVALSPNGLEFAARDELVGQAYMRTVFYRGWHLAMSMPGVFYRSRNGLEAYEQGPVLFDEDMRHAALMVRGERLLVFYTQVGEVPERILLSVVDLSGGWENWLHWQASPPSVVLEPELDYEGVDQPLVASVRGLVDGPVRQLRDPAIFTEDGQTYLLYSVAGESGIAIAEIALH